jgi:hypothetical protein
MKKFHYSHWLKHVLLVINNRLRFDSITVDIGRVKNCVLLYAYFHHILSCSTTELLSIQTFNQWQVKKTKIKHGWSFYQCLLVKQNPGNSSLVTSQLFSLSMEINYMASWVNQFIWNRKKVFLQAVLFYLHIFPLFLKFEAVLQIEDQKKHVLK